MNTLKTGILLAAIGGLAIGAGAYFFGTNGALIGLVIALLMQAVSYFQGHKIALSYAKARPLRQGEIPWLEQAVVQLSQRAGIPAPAMYISPDPQPNAFAAGRNPSVAVVCINEGLFNIMDRQEVVAVLAHEIAHVRNRDTLIMTVVAAMASFVNMLGYVAFFLPRSGDDDRNPLVDLLMLIVAPVAATMIQLAVSRTREFAADRMAAELMGDAQPMIGALSALERGTQIIPSRTAQPATAHMYIASPLRGAGGLANLFRTHPATTDRIRKLQELRGQLVA